MEASMKPYCLAIMVQLIYTGLFVISKAAFNQGINTYIFFFYRQALGSVLLLPIALLQRINAQPIISTRGLIKIFFCTLIGMEDVKPRSSSGIAKVTGIALCLAGVFTIAFFTGPSISPVNHHHAFASDPAPAGSKQVVPKAVWIKWTFLMVVANMCWSLWIVFQPALLKDCPDKMVVTVTQCLFSTVQSFIVAVVAERDFSKWKLRFDISLLAILYSGFMVTGVSYYLQTWCIEMRGPMFFAAWTPLCFVFTIFCSSFFLGEIVHLGSILGGILLVGSLYTMLWGKSKEVKTDNITHDTEKAEHKNSAESYPEEQHRHTTPEL
ncbi:WAT1-related protein At5g64700 isoform X2 [Sorghum bicolor]|uniref:WAT1-related protein At5g64700 isoform X2 n=1 Tax=Sorghum bicolor TaxID=4558 RepID=UPI000B42593C|nr:WAT1-related protein At5g64700 isoform X2 [Sorghum bicolor]|eukprot:XP_021312378.1 WAT1-related protein At5g64700 isoform X2 [Sorghum bicolor]